jgi:hypothetical protein
MSGRPEVPPAIDLGVLEQAHFLKDFGQALRRIPEKSGWIWIDQDLCRERGRALRGVPVQNTKNVRAFRRVNTAAALNGAAAAAPLC